MPQKGFGQILSPLATWLSASYNYNWLMETDLILKFHETITMSLQQPVMTFLGQISNEHMADLTWWIKYGRLPTNCTLKNITGVSNGPRFTGNTHLIRMHKTWWRECMYKGRYIAVWLMAKEQRERRGDKEKEGERKARLSWVTVVYVSILHLKSGHQAKKTS